MLVAATGTKIMGQGIGLFLIKIGETIVTTDFFIVDGEWPYTIVGLSLLEKLNTVIDLASKTLTFSSEPNQTDEIDFSLFASTVGKKQSVEIITPICTLTNQQLEDADDARTFVMNLLEGLDITDDQPPSPTPSEEEALLASPDGSTPAPTFPTNPADAKGETDGDVVAGVPADAEGDAAADAAVDAADAAVDAAEDAARDAAPDYSEEEVQTVTPTPSKPETSGAPSTSGTTTTTTSDENQTHNVNSI